MCPRFLETPGATPSRTMAPCTPLSSPPMAGCMVRFQSGAPTRVPRLQDRMELPTGLPTAATKRPCLSRMMSGDIEDRGR